MSNYNLTISPAQTEFILKPGVNLTQAYQVTNESDSNLYLRTEVLPWIPSGNEGNVSYDNITPDPNLTFTLNNADLNLGQVFLLKPQESRQLVLKISTTPETELNDYYYTFFVTQDQSQFSTSENNTQAFGKIGTHILLSVSNNENPKTQFEIRKFSLSPTIKDVLFTPLTFNSEIKNTASNFNKIKGVITINKNNLKIKELTLREDNVLAHHSRSIECFDLEACSISPPFWPGRYTATLDLDPSLNSKPATISFYVFPFSIILILLVLFVGFLAIFKTSKNRSK